MHDDIPIVMERETGAPDFVPMVAVGFGFMPVEDAKKSATAGHPVFVDVEFVKIAVPGDRQSIHLQPAQDSDRQRFPRAYGLFQQREKTAVEGMPVEQWPQVTRALAMTLKAMHIHTVEALAEVHDGNLAALGTQGRELRAKAKAFVKQAADSATAHKLAAENNALKDQMAAMQENFQQQIAALAQRIEPSGEKPARKKKAA